MTEGLELLISFLYRLICILCTGEGCWVGDSTGRIQSLDSRSHKPQGSLKGAGGAVRSICLHSSRPLLASVGLDRHLRLYDTRTKRCLSTLYMKQMLTAVAFQEGQGSLYAQSDAFMADQLIKEPPSPEGGQQAKSRRLE